MKIQKTIMMIAAAALFAACDKEELPATQGEPLQIVVDAQNFASDEPQLRAAVGNDYWINFSNGDQIGVFSVASDGTTILDNNVPYSYTGSAWQPAGAAQVYKRTGAGYVAYFPYDAANNGRTIAQIAAGFTPPANQSSASDHAAAGLMTGTGTLSGATLSITLSHALSLLEVSVPAGATGVGISLGGTDITSNLYPLDAATFRYVVQPAATATVSGKYTMGGNIYMWSQNVSLTAGKYARINIQ